MNAFTIRLAITLCGVIAFLSHAQQQPAPAIDPQADAILRKMGQTLAAAKALNWTAHATTDQILSTGQKVQSARNQKVLVRRPDRAAADNVGDAGDLHVRYDGKSISLYNPQAKTWAKTEAPADIEKTLDMLVSKYGMVIPMADFFFADPYATLIERVRSGVYLGEAYVLDTKCHHLAFRQDTVDWQIWIDTGDKPLPRKLVITYKDSPGWPQFTVLLSEWNLSADAKDESFTVAKPADATEVEFAAPPAAQPTGENK